MWKRPSRLTVVVNRCTYRLKTAWLNCCGFVGAPRLQMAGSLAGAVPGSRPLHVMPRRTTLNPSRAMSEASAAEKFHGFPGAGYSS